MSCDWSARFPTPATQFKITLKRSYQIISGVIVGKRKLSDPCDDDCDAYEAAYESAYDYDFQFILGLNVFPIQLRLRRRSKCEPGLSRDKKLTPSKYKIVNLLSDWMGAVSMIKVDI